MAFIQGIRVKWSVSVSPRSNLLTSGLFQELHRMDLVNAPVVPFKSSAVFGICSKPMSFLPVRSRNFILRPLVVEARANTRRESVKIRNRRMRKKFNGTPTKPRLSVFCSENQLYVMLVDDQNKKCLYYGSTLQKSIRDHPPCSTIEAAKRVGEKLLKACNDLNINEISTYDRNGFARGERMQAFEIAISHHGFLARQKCI
ncbi:50S ribosomal protein L18, chloroplastic [Morella rubra]|uniref:50S ribosomal protein L18, chloroplastic n=1 Tax=Morella rubra TaxID=262757 RepID=A0A6A1V982_9ROSI|nr:50S ribosomal protein L18, chloroplastic [Morella rubra]